MMKIKMDHHHHHQQQQEQQQEQTNKQNLENHNKFILFINRNQLVNDLIQHILLNVSWIITFFF